MSKTMETPFTPQDKTWIQKTIRETYSKAAKSPDSLFSYSTDYEALKTLNYNPELLQALPSSVAASYCGVGNPFTLGPINEGNCVLDMGCGAGIDKLISGMSTGPSLHVLDLIFGSSYKKHTEEYHDSWRNWPNRWYLKKRFQLMKI